MIVFDFHFLSIYLLIIYLFLEIISIYLFFEHYFWLFYCIYQKVTQIILHLQLFFVYCYDYYATHQFCFFLIFSIIFSNSIVITYIRNQVSFHFLIMRQHFTTFPFFHYLHPIIDLRNNFRVLTFIVVVFVVNHKAYLNFNLKMVF